MRRSSILGSAVVMQMCLGATYSWSVFVKPLRDLTGLSQGGVQFPFSVFYFAFPATMIFSGFFLRRFGPRTCAVIGGVLFGSGWLTASLGAHSFACVVLGIGLLAGMGVGFAYVVPIAVCVQWFPENKGLVTGAAVAGFGGGAALVGQISGMMMQEWGFSPYAVFGLLGSLFLILVTGGGMFMQYAPEFRIAAIHPLDFMHVVRRKEFRILYLAMITGLAAGFAVNANLKDLSPTVNLSVGIASVSLFAIANAFGRVVWGMIFDRIRSADAVRINLVVQALVLIAAAWMLKGEAGFLGFAFLAGFNYGGVLVIYASSAARIWGREYVGQVYGILFSANILAAASPVISGFVYGTSGSFIPALWTLAGLMMLAALFVTRGSAVLNSETYTSRDEQQQKRQFST